MPIDLYVKYSLFFSAFKENLNFLNTFSKNTQISSSMKILPLGAELFHAEGKTDEQRDGWTDREA